MGLMKTFGNAKIVSPDLEAQKLLKKAKAEQWHTDAINAGFSYQGKIYQIDDGSLSVMNRFMSGLLASFPTPHGGYWRAMDNSKTPMTDAELTAFITAAGVYVGALRQDLHNLKDDIEGCGSLAALEAVPIPPVASV